MHFLNNYWNFAKKYNVLAKTTQKYVNILGKIKFIWYKVLKLRLDKEMCKSSWYLICGFILDNIRFGYKIILKSYNTGCICLFFY